MGDFPGGMCDSVRISNPGPLHWEHGVLATGPSGRSQEHQTFFQEFKVWQVNKLGQVSGGLMKQSVLKCLYALPRADVIAYGSC